MEQIKITLSEEQIKSIFNALGKLEMLALKTELFKEIKAQICAIDENFLFTSEQWQKLLEA